MAEDRIRLIGIRGFGYHGVFDHERRDGQEFVVDVVLHLETSAAAMSDDLAETVDYGGLAAQVASVITGPPVRLLETLAERVAALALAPLPVDAVDVVVHKPQAPITVPFEDVAVEIHRSRSYPPALEVGQVLAALAAGRAAPAAPPSSEAAGVAAGVAQTPRVLPAFEVPPGILSSGPMPVVSAAALAAGGPLPVADVPVVDLPGAPADEPIGAPVDEWPDAPDDEWPDAPDGEPADEPADAPVDVPWEAGAPVNEPGLGTASFDQIVGDTEGGDVDRHEPGMPTASDLAAGLVAELAAVEPPAVPMWHPIASPAVAPAFAVPEIAPEIVPEIVPEPAPGPAAPPAPVPDLEAFVPVLDRALDAAPQAPVEVVLALGSNQGPSQEILRHAVADLSAVPGLEVRAVAPLARTAAVGGPEQPDFLNTVVVGRTTLSPRALLAACQAVEAAHGRVRTQVWGPRTLDIDIIVHGATIAAAEDLELPHPRASQRAFVLQPWAQVDPDAVLPGLGGGPVAALATTAPDRDGIRWMALDWWTAPAD